jgi:hypothetical protein
LRHEESTLTLQPLSLAETERLLMSMFGEVSNVRLLANRLFDVGNGSPAATMQLCQHLLDRDIVGFRDGSWLLPDAIDQGALPDSVTDALRARLAQLTPSARSLGQAIALTELRSLTLEQCQQLTAAEECANILSYLDALVSAEIVRAFGDQYALTQPAWGTLLRADISPERGRSLHARIAAMFASEPDSHVLAAGHLLACGQGRKAVELMLALLETTGKHLTDEPWRLPEHLRSLPLNWMQTLEATVNEAARLGLPRRDRLRLQQLWLQRLSITLRPRCDVANEVVQQLYADSGLRDYAELHDTVSEAERLRQALARAKQRYDTTPEHERGLPPADAIPGLVRLYAHLIGMMGGSADLAFFRGLPSLAPLVGLSPAIALVHVNIESTCHLFAGRIEQAHDGYLELLRKLDESRDSGLAPSLHRYMKLAVTYAVAVQETMGGRAGGRRATPRGIGK